MKHSLVVPIAILISGVVVAIAVYMVMPKPNPSAAINAAHMRALSPDDHIFGNPAAPIMIVEYSDFDCTYCKSFHDTLYSIVTDPKFSGKVAWTYRHFPLTELHEHSFAHARASECVAQTAGNNTFWTFAHALYEAQPVDPQQYGTIASKIGLSGSSFATCLSGDTTAIDAKIKRDRQDALNIGADGTPYTIIVANGKISAVMNGGYPYAAVRQLVDEALESIKP